MENHLTIRLPKRLLKVALILTVVGAVIAPIAVSASHQFTDVPTDNIFHDNIGWLADNDVTKGCNPPANDQFCPDANVTRGQMAAFMQRLSEGKIVDAATAEDAAMLDGQPASAYAASGHTHGSDDVVDGPGIAVATPQDFVDVTGIGQFDQVGRVQIATPGAGYVVVQAIGYVNVSHTAGTADNIGLNLLDSATAPGTIFYEGASSFIVSANEPSGSYRFPFTTQSVYEVSGPETVTIYLYVDQLAGANSTTTDVAHSQIIATYYPTAHGTVSIDSATPSGTADGFGN